MKYQAEDAASPKAAWSNGQLAAQRGAYEAARLWLERAAKLAPDDPRIALDLANVRIFIKTPEQLRLAVQALEGLARAHDYAPVELALLAAQKLLGDGAAAATTLGRLLQRHCVPGDDSFEANASLIAEAAGTPGWCGLLPGGGLRISAMPGLKLVFLLDGQIVDLPPGADGYQAPAGGMLSILAGGRALCGSPLNLVALRRVEGLVSAVDGALIGWAHQPAAPEQEPRLVLHDAAGKQLKLKLGAVLAPDEAAPFARRHSFAVGAKQLAGLQPPLRVCGANGADIMGSPLNPALFTPFAPKPASFSGPAQEIMPPRQDLAVVIPVYRDLAATRACVGSVQAALAQAHVATPAQAHVATPAQAPARLIVVDDATPEPAMAVWLDELAAAGQIELLRHETNLGFPAAANAGLRAAEGRDVLLLNSDTLLPPGALAVLAAAVYAQPDIGSATPFSNDATILSYPKCRGRNALPDLKAATALAEDAFLANGEDVCEIPTGVGFCMYIRHDCLAASGHFRTDLFGQGYGEENDWCLRARQAGYKHVAALGAYVAHVGGSSFRGAGRALRARNARTLNRLYPGYDEMIAEFIAADPLAPARKRLDMARFARNRGGAAQAVLLISHNHGGGVGRIVAAQMQRLRAAGLRALLLVPGAPDDPAATPFPWDAELSDGEPGDYPNLRFHYPQEEPDLLRLLAEQNITEVVLHHGLGHHAKVRELATALGVPGDVIVHDYASFCPRINLLSQTSSQAPLRYCGEPNVNVCETCVEISGDETHERIGPVALNERSAREFAQARRVVAPCADAANRIGRHFPGIRPVVTPWENDQEPVQLKPPGQGRRRIIIIGGIGPAKGFDLLIECAKDAAARRLELEYVVAGASADDAALLEAGRIFVTGAYAEGEATGLIKSLNGDLAFLPSIWPETWCFALSEAWRAGLYTVAFDLGAQGTRLKATGRGAVLPLGLPVARINDILIAWRPNLRDANIANS